ncbi:hypothetical protein ACMHYB_34385 [Sorangium sp. So ce1128]
MTTSAMLARYKCAARTFTAATPAPNVSRRLWALHTLGAATGLGALSGGDGQAYATTQLGTVAAPRVGTPDVKWLGSLRIARAKPFRPVKNFPPTTGS